MTEYNLAQCSECGHDLGPDDPNNREPCPSCGSNRRTVGVSAHMTVSASVSANLTAFVDTSSETAIAATTSALGEIAAWTELSDSLTVRHVIKGHISPSKTGVDSGPFSDDEFRAIVATAFEDTREKEGEKWDRIKSFVPWALSAIGLILTAFGRRMAYLRFLSDGS